MAQITINNHIDPEVMLYGPDVSEYYKAKKACAHGAHAPFCNEED